ncbi:MAG: hypothetical protein CM1200mP3_12990 [Chloroflexota bacterium]|nr:MAG: hypothetical protein CM1200mP3_12990 [Chloroflexota bacterium]
MTWTLKNHVSIWPGYTASESNIEDDMLMWMNSYSLSTDYREVETISTQGNLNKGEIRWHPNRSSVYFPTSKGRIQLNSKILKHRLIFEST